MIGYKLILRMKLVNAYGCVPKIECYPASIIV